MIHDKDSEHIQSFINSKVNKWLEFNSQIFGFFGLGLAYSSLGMKDPQFFAVVSLIFVFGAWIPTAIKMHGILTVCRKYNHPSIGYKKIITLGFPYMLGLATTFVSSFWSTN